ncbi:MAG: nucleotidyltransferase domain-containing protein [Xanthomonadaceae bacterium]|nr:nucleotidyltransferase domain-containing protein [Rhodospirillaceae bacterium]NIA18117.1 nucleotidyltransferase domain-containing protein [Xanthomonadaceae bacterium]
MNLTKKQLNNLFIVFKKYNTVFAYLFGSQATKKADKKSDFDIAIMLPEKYNKNKRFDIRLKMMAELSEMLNYKKVDIIILNDVSSLLFKYVIIYEGKVIYENEIDKRVDYATYIQSEYFDFVPFLNERNKLFLKRSI